MLNSAHTRSIAISIMAIGFCLMVSTSILADTYDELSFSSPELKPWGGSLVLSQGVIKADSPFVDNDEALTTDVRDVILNSYYELNGHLRFAGQLQYRQLGDLDDRGGFNIDYLFADWRWYSDGSDALGIRIGRIKNKAGIYNDSRDIPFARPSMFLPQSMYPDVLRDQFLRLDGAEVYGQHLMSDIELHWALSAGQTDYDDQVEEHLGGMSFDGDIENDKNIQSSLELILPWQLSLFASYSFIEYSLSDHSFYLIPSGAQSDNYRIGVQWNWYSWQLTSEYSLVNIQLTGLHADTVSIDGFAQGEVSQESESYYLQANYAFNEEWSLLARYDVFYFDKDDKYGRNAPASDYDVRSGLNSYARDRTLALNWQPASEWLLSLEYHYVTGYAWVPPLFPSTADNIDDKHWSMVAAQVAYRFDW